MGCTTGRLRVGAVLIAASLIGLSCGGDSTSSSDSSGTDANASTASSSAGAATSGEAKSVVVFMPSTSNNYLAEWKRGLEAQAAELNLSLKVIENNFDQAEQDIQVQQAIESGDKPDIYVFWPADSLAGVASLRQLSQTGVPTAVANQPPPEEAKQFMTFYAGVDDYLNGQVSGELMLEARDAFVAAGNELSSPGGNLLEIKFAAGYQASAARSQGFLDATATEPFEILASEFAGFDNEAGYNTTSQLIAANRSSGIDFVYAHNDALAAGSIRALEEAGLVPGGDVYVVGGTCHGDLSALEAGKQFGSGLQAARLEGVVVALSVGRYFANGETVEEGEDYPDASAEFPTNDGPVKTFNYIPNPGIKFTGDPVANKAVLEDTQLWGDNMVNLCTY